MARLGDICEFFSGTGFPNQYQGNIDGKYPFYKVSDISQNVQSGHEVLQTCNNYVSDEVVKAIKGTIVPAHTIVFAKIGEALRLNRRAITPSDCLVDNNVMGIKPVDEKLTLKYFYYFMSLLDLQKYCEATTVPSVRKSVLSQVEMLLPSKEEQHRVVSILDKLTHLISLRKQQLAKLDELVKARFVEMFGDPVHNTKAFPVFGLGELCKVGSSKRVYQSEQTATGIPFLRVSDLNARIDDGKEISELFISHEKYAELQAHELVPMPGDILVTSRGTLGKCYIVKESDKFYFQDGMISWLSEMGRNVTSLYLAYLFAMPGIQKQIANLQVGSTVAYLSITMLKKLDIMLPPLELQKRFSALVEQTGKSKLTIQQSLDKMEVLKKSLMQEYFG